VSGNKNVLYAIETRNIPGCMKHT